MNGEVDAMKSDRRYSWSNDYRIYYNNREYAWNCVKEENLCS